MKKFTILIIFAIVLSISTCAEAMIFTEVLDAGDTLYTARYLNGGINEIHGEIAFNGDFDIYKFYFNFTNTVDFKTTFPGDFFMVDYTLFNESGNPLLVSSRREFSYSFSPGTYYLALADWDVAAMDVNNIRIADDHNYVLNSQGVFDHFEITSIPYRTGEYVINFSETTSSPNVIPEPATMILFGGGLLGGAFLRRKRRV